VGKTSILLRYVRGEYSDKQQSTIQASYLDKKVTIGLTTSQLSIWDTAGQERFHALGPIYYRDAGKGKGGRREEEEEGGKKGRVVFVVVVLRAVQCFASTVAAPPPPHDYHYHDLKQLSNTSSSSLSLSLSTRWLVRWCLASI